MLSFGEPILYALMYLAMLYVRPQEYIPAFSVIPIMPVLLVTAYGTWLSSKEPRDLSPSQFKLLFWQSGVMFWSVFLSGQFAKAFQTLVDFLPLVVMYCVLATRVDAVDKFKWVFRVLSLSMTLISYHCFKQAQDPEGMGWTGAQMIGTRVTYIGYLNDPNDLSLAILMTLPMQCYLWSRSGWLFKVFWTAAMVLEMDTIRQANSRGAFLALAAMLVHHGFVRFGMVRTLLVAPLGVLPLLLFGPSRVNEISNEEESAEGRLEAWKEGFDMLMQHPLFGVGTGNFTEHHFRTAHNSYVLAVAEMGVVGFFVWITGLVLSWMMMQRLCLATWPADMANGPQVVVDPKAPSPRFGMPATKQVVHVKDHQLWDETRLIAHCLWIGYTSALVAIFFLSRTYAPFLYVQMALMIAAYQMARRCGPPLPLPSFELLKGRLMGFTLAAVFGLYVVTRLLYKG
jgi:putative inorganic carbon (HCO3(-)) transporter